MKIEPLDYEALKDMDYDAARDIVRKKNLEYYEAFYDDLVEEKHLSSSTAHRHINNVSCYLDVYLCYYDFMPIEQGCYELGGFLGDFYIRKFLDSSKARIKSIATSVKKFYQFMLKEGYVQQEDYDYLVALIKADKEWWLESMDAYLNTAWDDFF